MKIYSICFAILLLLATAPASYGCDCAEVTPEMAFENAKIVFIGKMIEGTEKNVGDATDASKRGIEAGDVTFEIDAFNGFKGIDKGTITLKVPSNKGTSCGPYGLIPGESYVVYAYANANEPEKTLSTGVCTRTALLSEAKEDIEFFRKLQEIGYGTIKGYISLATHRIENSEGEPYKLPDIKIRMTGLDKTLTLEIDKFGNFETTGLRAGTYYLTPELPQNYESEKQNEEVTILGRPTHYLSFTIQHKGRVSGVIEDGYGMSYDPSSIFLENSNTRVPGNSLGQDGRFEIRGVPPGEYVMYMELRRNDTFETRKYYYPGTYDRTQAARLKVGLSEVKDIFKFTMPREFRVRMVSGTVLWRDGKPVTDGGVIFEYLGNLSKSRFTPQNSPNFVRTDGNGRFSLKVIGGMSYLLRAVNATRDLSAIRCADKTIMPNKNVAGVKLVLSKPGPNSQCMVPM